MTNKERHIAAIKALEQQPCDDAISRQAVIDMIEGFIADATSHGISPRLDPYYVMNGIKGLPPVTPQQKSNLELICEELAAENDKLIEQLKQTQKYGKMLICPSCGLDVHSDFKCCPRCGAKMQESEDKE